MSKDIADRFKLLESVARKESPRDEDIQNFAESTMNELLAWYGYGDKAMMRHADHSTTPNASRDESDPTLRPSKSRFLCSVTEALDSNPTPDLGQPISDSSDRGGGGAGCIPKRSPSSSSSSQRLKDQFARDVSSHSLDSIHSLVTAARHCRPDSVNSMASTDSTESNLLASTKVPTRETSDHSQNHQRHPAAMTKMKKVCDWCHLVPPSISLADSVDGLNQLSFCSELCLNHYKMNLFCTETRQYLQQIQNSEDAGDVATVAASDNKILITPELWMEGKQKKAKVGKVEESKRSGAGARFNENQMHERRGADDNCSNYRLLDTPSEREDDVVVGCHSDCGSNVDTSNGMEFAEYLLQDAQRRKHKRKKELEFSNFKSAGCPNSEVSSETSLDVGKCTARFKSFETSEGNSVVHSVEERFSDGERRGKRLKTSKEAAVSPASSSYPAASVAGNIKKCLEAHDGLLSVPAKDLGSSYSSPGSGRVRGARSAALVKGDVFPLLHHLAASSDLSNDPTHFRRTSDASNFVERSSSKSNVPTANCLGSQQGKSSTPLQQFTNSPLFGSAPLPPNSLFSHPGMPSLMHLLGPTFNPQFLGAVPTVPPSFPFLGLPSMFSMPGGGGGTSLGGGGGVGGAQVPPGIPVPPPMTNPWSNLLPPNTLMIPYPVLLPLPIPIPIPFPVPAKCGQKKSNGDTADNNCSRRQNDSGKTDRIREDVKDRAGDLRSLPSMKNVDKSGDSPFPGHTIVCSCCRSESVPGRPPLDPHSRSTFCSPCRSKADVIQHSSGFTDNLNDVPSLFAAAAAAAAASVASQNLAIDFSMARDSKSSSMRSPSLQGGTNNASFVATPSSSVTIKTEPLDLAISGENNNLSSSSPSSSSSLMMMKSSCELQSLAPSLPYLARRSLILDAPSVSKEKPVHAEKHFADASSKKFMYCKRRYPSLHIKTK